MVTEIEVRTPLGIDAGVRPGRHPVGAHALAELPHADQQLRHLGGGELVVDAGREQCWQASSAAWYTELLTPSCCAPGNFALLAPASGSGKSGTPRVRMHWEKASSGDAADAPALGRAGGRGGRAAGTGG